MIAVLLFIVAPLVAASSGDWIKSKRADANDEFIFRVDLQRLNLNQLESHFWAVSDPTSQRFRKYLSSEDISGIISPATNDVDKVFEWLSCAKVLPFNELRSEHVMKTGELYCYPSIYKDFIYVKGSVGSVESQFQVELMEYHLRVGERWDMAKDLMLVRAEEGSVTSLIPESLRSVVTRVHGISELPPIDAMVTSASGSKRGRSHHRTHKDGDASNTEPMAREPGEQIVPSIIWKTYGLDALLPLNASLLLGNTSCAEFQDEEFLQTDVAKFETLFGLPAVKVDIIGSNNGGYFGEGSLDTEYLTGTAPGLGVTWIGVPWGSSFASGMLST